MEAVVDHYTMQEAMKVINDEKDFNKFVWIGKYPHTQKTMRDRKKATGMEMT